MEMAQKLTELENDSKNALAKRLRQLATTLSNCPWYEQNDYEDTDASLNKRSEHVQKELKQIIKDLSKLQQLITTV